MKRRFVQCDVFSPVPTKGNALAVVVDGHGLTDEQMQNFAAWTNLAETTFLSPPTAPTADYRVRIFTPTREMQFAGHPTLGSCASWLHVGGIPHRRDCVVQECAIGLVEIHRQEDVLAFVAPPTKIAPLAAEAVQRISKSLSLTPEQVKSSIYLDNGPQWQVLMLDSADSVLAVDSSAVAWPVEKSIGLIGEHAPGNECDYEVRMLAPSSGMSEDPITGSLNSALAHWLQSAGQLTKPITIAQGTVINRQGRVYIKPNSTIGSNEIRIGGHTHVLVEGSVEL